MNLSHNSSEAPTFKQRNYFKEIKYREVCSFQDSKQKNPYKMMSLFI